MQTSIYAQYVDKFFPLLVTSITERLNESRNGLKPYLFRQLLDPVYSADGRWASITADYTRVAADVVAMDTELPIKSRDTLYKESGEIPKLGLKLALTEKKMKELDALIAQNAQESRIVQLMFEDLPRVMEAIWLRIEDIFLSELSTGIGLSERNDGTGCRINVGYLDANKFGVSVPWLSDIENSTPLDDIQAIFDKAMDDDNIITDVYADDAWLQGFYKSHQARAQYGFNMGVTTTNTAVPVLDLDKAQQVLQTKWGVNVHRIATKIKTEINGKKQNHSPWAKGVAVFTCDPYVGNLVWTDTAESNRRVEGVAYETVEDYMLLSRYSKVDPLREFTASQAMVVPIVNNVDRIYTLNSLEPQG